MTSFQCAICNSVSGNFILKKKYHSFFQCKYCQHVQVYPLPDDNELFNHYNTTDDTLDASYPYQSIADYIKYPKARYHFTKYLFNDLLNLAEMQDKNCSILEIGTGSGTDLAILRDYYGYKNLVGFDINNIAIQKGAQLLNLNLIGGNLSELKNLKKDSFKVSFSFQTIEHTRQPVELLHIVNSLLCSKGIIVINVPNYNSIFRLIMSNSWQIYDPPAHLHYFTTSSLKKLLSTTGFSIKKIYTENKLFPGSYCADLLRLYHYFFLKNSFNTKNGTPPLFSTYDRFYYLLYITDILSRLMTLPFWMYMRAFHKGVSLIAIAKKI